MRWILRLRVYIIIFLAVMLISAAVIFSVLRAVLPYATGYKNEIQQEISQQIGLPVEIDSIDAAIHWFSPRLKLIDVAVYDEKNKVPLFNFKEAFVELDVIASILHGGFIVADVGLVGADISIEKLSDNEWLVQGIKFTGEGSNELPEKFLYMLQNADYLLHDSNIYYQDHTGEKLNISLLDVNIDVKNDFNKHDIKISINLPEAYGRDLVVVANLSGDIDSLDGDIYVEAHQVNVKRLNDDFDLLDQYKVGAVVDINLWATLDDNNIQTLYAQLVSRNLLIKNKATAESWKTNYLSANIRYVNGEEHWNIAVSDFYFGEKSKPAWQHSANIIISENKKNYYLTADFLRVVDVQDMVEVFLNKEKLADFNKLKSYKLQADIYNLDLQLPKQMSKQQLLNKLKLQATVIDFSIDYPAAENKISLAGIDTSLHYENNQAILDLMSKDAEVKMEGLFRGPLFAETVQGKLILDYDGSNWQLKSNQLQVQNSHINTFSRLDIQFSSVDNIFVDIQTDFYNANAKYTSHYLPVGVMAPSVVDWLDMAVISGYVPGGSFILHGNLSGFPFDEHDGVFQVLFSPRNVKMRFLQDWPLLTGTSATVKFNNKSLIVKDAKAKTQGANLFNGFVGIMDLTNPHLTVNTKAHSATEDLQSYIFDSPLDELLGEAMRLFQFDGASDLNLKIDVPLNKEKIEVAIDGRLNFIDTTIYYPALDYEINNINGVLNFTNDSISADSIKAKVQNNKVSIDALTRDGDSGREVVFQLDGIIAADYLLHSYDWLPEELISGESMWSVEIDVPYQAEDYLVHIKTNSYLDNVVFQLSDKVHKQAASKVSFSTIIDVLDNNGLHVDAKAAFVKADDMETEDVFELYAVRDENKVWDFDIDSKYITGKGEFTEGLAKETQVKLDLEKIDLHALFVNENNKQAQSLKPNDFPPLSWKAKKVLWDDWVFTDVKLETGWHEHGMLINKCSLKGPSMNFDARGTWLTSWRGSHETVLQGTIKGGNLGETLTGLGFQRSIGHGKYKATFNAKWLGEPYAISWANMKGKSSFAMENGEILEAEPGASGRLLGLLNIFKLANRLAFDFDDVYRKGFSFDSIKGEFEFVNGDGSLKKFDVSAPAADINMFGSIGLLKRDYGLLMRVKPHTDSLTFAGGALLGGVAVGAGLALIQKVFDLGVIGHNVYSITGSWDDPTIDKIIERSTESDADEDDF